MKSMELAKKLRKQALVLTTKNKASHIGSILSIIDIISVLFTDIINITNSKEKRDRFILSKGHSGLAYFCLLKEQNILENESDYYNYKGIGYKKDLKSRFKGLDFISCSLGQGIGVGVGIALALKHKDKTKKVFVLVGDGECNEGSVFEALTLAVKLELNNLVVIVDQNNIQAIDTCKHVLNINYQSLFASIGLDVVKINGHDHTQIKQALKINSKVKPLVILAQTVKGKGVKVMENNLKYHYEYLEQSQINKALEEIEFG